MFRLIPFFSKPPFIFILSHNNEPPRRIKCNPLKPVTFYFIYKFYKRGRAGGRATTQHNSVIVVISASSSVATGFVVVVHDTGSVMGQRRHLPLAFRCQLQLPLPKLVGFYFAPQLLLQPRLLVEVLLLDFGEERCFVGRASCTGSVGGSDRRTQRRKLFNWGNRGSGSKRSAGSSGSKRSAGHRRI